jgi:XTP/dITP diphosphohydrolase
VQIVIASNNVHKIREIRSILKALPTLDVYSLLDFPHYKSPDETGSSFEENALLKATHAATSLNRLVIADDSGLVVPALKGAPGIHSAYFAGKGATDKENRIKLLQEMRNLVLEHQRQAYFECCIALVSPQGIKKTVKGTCEGMITQEEKGSRGFGYDPLFMKFEYSKTFGELEEETKNRISHRRKALDKILLALEALRDSSCTTT